jgi:hypothetical protein
MNPAASRNKFRGLQQYLRLNYEILPDTDPHSVYVKLNSNGWAGVPPASVYTAVRNLKGHGKKPPVGGPTSSRATPNILLTLPLPKKGSVTLQYLEARELYDLLHEIFGPLGK